MSNKLQELSGIENLCKESLTECSKCKGERVIKETFYLLRVCRKCNGVGLLDWIDNVTGDSKLESERTKNIEFSIVRSNVSRLMGLITEEYARFGEVIDVRIDHISTQHHLDHHDHRHFNNYK